jgi:hypothetical protein
MDADQKYKYNSQYNNMKNPGTRALILSFVIASTIICLTPAVMAVRFQVGVSPAVINLGEISAGESKRGSLVLTTTSDEGFLVNIDVAQGSNDFFGERYSYVMEAYSEQDASSWLSFLNAPVYLDVSTESSDPNIIKASKVNFIVNVPDDAEPGYHLVEIIPNPEVPSGWSTGVNIVAVTKINLLFKVLGDADREGEILDMNARIVGKRTMVDIYFQNTGSVSMYARADNIMIYDSEKRLIDSIWSSKAFIEPGEVVKLTGFVTRPLDPGSYLASANVSYMTGHAAKETDLWLEPPSLAAAQDAPSASEQAAFPWWIVIIAILIIGYVIYRYV